MKEGGRDRGGEKEIFHSLVHCPDSTRPGLQLGLPHGQQRPTGLVCLASAAFAQPASSSWARSRAKAEHTMPLWDTGATRSGFTHYVTAQPQ